MSRAPRDCPLCAARTCSLYARVKEVAFLRCARCALVFRQPECWPGAEAEQALYRSHRNQPDDPGYRDFVRPLAAALLERLEAERSGLDFGCGEGSALAAILVEAGQRVRGYDPLFCPDARALAQDYDFIALCEVAEHLHRPRETFAMLDQRLRPGGLLALRTGFLPPPERFAGWHYLRDPTHVLFYSPQSLRWLATSLGHECEIPCADVAILRKPALPTLDPAR